MAQSRWEGDKIGRNQKVRQLQTYTPEQMELQRMGEERVGPASYISRLSQGEPGIFDEMEAPAYRQFNQQMGNLSSRFSNLGGQGSLSSRGSSGFRNEASSAASNFAQDLQSRRQDLMRQATMDLHGMSQQLLGNRPYERYIEEQEPDQGWDWGGMLGGAGGAILGGLTGGPMGAIGGAGAGYNALKRGGGGGSSFNFGMPSSQSGGFGNWNNLWGGGDQYANYSGSGSHYNFPGA